MTVLKKFYTRTKAIAGKILIKTIGRKNISIKNGFSQLKKLFIDIMYRLNILKRINAQFYKNINELLALFPGSNDCSYYRRADINIGIITDEYIFNYYKDAVNLFYLSPENYTEIINSNRIDIVLFVSCWKGMGQTADWRGMRNRQKAIEIFLYAKEKCIKTVFQSIEDPSNYSVFIEIAKAADYIFTSCVEVIDDYKRDTGNPNVFVLEYGINPLLHNPIGIFNKQNADSGLYNKDSVFFAGSWAPRYKERCDDMQMVFDGVIHTPNTNLIIADRNLYIKGYVFPVKYAKYLIPPIEHTRLQKLHKLFTWSININSIKKSRTMCAMRIYEIQALGGLIISNYALSVSNIFPNIFIVFEGAEINHIINGYTSDQIINMQLDSIRNVMSEHTVFDKLNYIFHAIGYNHCFASKRVLVLCEKKSESVRCSFERQTYREKELRDFSELRNLNKDNYDYLIVFRDSADYGRYYLEDLVNAFKYVSTAYTMYADNQNSLPFQYVDNANSQYETLYDMAHIDFGRIDRLCELKLRGFQIAHPKQCFQMQKSPKKLGVIIPVYNNGVFLKDRCIKSLVRSSIFDQMQLYLIDDGSQDEETIVVIKELERLYGNITTYFYHDGGSGSASRPRNKGIELCREPYVTYLDPDNEAINDGYAVLMNIIEKQHVDFVFGTILKVADMVSPLRFMYKEGLIASPRQELLKRKFKAQSIQACVINKNVIIENQITSPVGAAGQDTLFFYELMLTARSAYHTLLPIHIYYAQRSNSLINTINKAFFEKFLLLEEYQVLILQKYDVFDEYLTKKFNQFYSNWYLEKLKLIESDDYEPALKILEKIRLLYMH